MTVYTPNNAMRAVLDPEMCAAGVHDRTGMGVHQCRRKGILEHDGHKWCKQHYPPFVEARDMAREDGWKAKWAVRKEEMRKRHFAERFFDVLRLIADGHNNPRQIAQDILDEYDGKGE